MTSRVRRAQLRALCWAGLCLSLAEVGLGAVEQDWRAGRTPVSQVAPLGLSSPPAVSANSRVSASCFWLITWDRVAQRWVNSRHHPALDWILLPISLAGEAGAVWIVTGFTMILAGRGRARRVGLVLLITLAVADRMVGDALAQLLYRTRPYLADPEVRQLGIRWSGSSFPSGHANAAVAATILLGGAYRGLLPALILFTTCTLYARPYLGMHYPLDVLAGAAIGAITGFAAWRIALGRVGFPPQTTSTGQHAK